MEEKIGRMLFDINHSNIFDAPPRAVTIKTIYQCDIKKKKLRSFSTEKETIKK